MNTGIITLFGVGVLIIILGLLIWKKQKISLLHGYHYKNVKESDVKAYTKENGKALIIIGIGLLLSGVGDLMNIMIGWIGFGICFIVGMIMFVKAQKKYNGGIF